MTGFRPWIIMKEAQWRQSSTIKSTEFVSLSYHSKRVIRLVMCVGLTEDQIFWLFEINPRNGLNID